MRDIRSLDPETGEKTALVAGGEEKYSIVLRPDRQGAGVLDELNEGRHSIQRNLQREQRRYQVALGLWGYHGGSTSLKERRRHQRVAKPN